MIPIAVGVLSALVLVALLRGIIGYLWSKSDEGQTWLRGHALGWW